jgi:hypothetical protein
MRIAEHILFQLANALYRTEIAHSSDVKSALQHIDAYDAYRAGEIIRITEAVERYRVPMLGKTIDVGENDCGSWLK